MSKFENLEQICPKNPKDPDLGCISGSGPGDIDAEILRQINKAKTDCLAGKGLLTPGEQLLEQLDKDGYRSPVKDKWDYPVTKISPDSPYVSDCGWDRPYVQTEREHVAATINKYFSKIDQGYCFGLGKDHEISKEELIDFLVSDQSEELSEHETADLIKVLKNFDKIRDSESDAGCIMNAGITRGDLWAYAHDAEPVYERILFDLRKGRSKGSEILEFINK